MIGRERERTALQEALAGSDGTVTVALAGELGIGKTTLWRELVEHSPARVLRCRPAAAETQLAFAAIADLLDEVLDEALPELPGPQRHALEVALLRADPGDAPPDVRALASAVLGVLRALAARGPVLVAIDDAQWLDASSARVLEFALRRLRDERVGVLFAFRGGTGEAPPLGLEPALRVDLGPLGLSALHRLLMARLDRSFSRPVLRRLHKTSGGNPLYALELARAPDAVPDSLRGLVHERLAALPAEVRRLLELVAVLFDRRIVLVRTLARAEALDGAIDAAVAAGVLAEEDERLAFTHPLLAAVVYAEIGPERRRELHGRLARAEPGEQARALHLALASEEADAEIAAELERAARRALASGAAETAGTLAEHAARLTPETEQAARRTVAAAAHHITAGDPARARSLLSALVARLAPGPARAEALALLCWVVPDDGLDGSRRCGEQALAEAGEDARLRAITHQRLAVVERIRGNLHTSAEHSRTAAELAAGDPLRLALALASLGYTRMVLDARVAPESRRAAALERSLPGFLGHQAPSGVLGLALVHVDAHEEARPLLECMLERATETGHEDARANNLWRLADLERRAGRWRRAQALSDEACELAAQVTTEQERNAYAALGALLKAGTGRVAEARREALAGLAVAERIGDTTYTIQHRGVLGFVELSLGAFEAAAGWLEPASDELIRRGYGELSIFPVVQNELDAVVALGRLDRAERLVAHLEDLGARTERSWTRAIAARGRALLLAAHGDLEAAGESLERALIMPQPFELARTLLVIGALERRAKRKRASREALERAAAIFAALPAPLWEARARGELARLGVRVAPDDLTETQARIATLAAAGMTNPEIAAAVFVSRKTVEANLSKIYRKLGVRSRVELARRHAQRT